VLIVPQREPISTAKIISTVDNMSGGRFILGVGVGWQEEEFLAMGINTFKDRGKVTDEYLRIYKELWTNDDPRFDGRYSKFSGIRFFPKPIQKPHPPIWIGGYTKRSMRRAAALGDVWSPVGQQPQAALEPEDMAQAIKELGDMTERAGRPRDSVETSFTVSVLFNPRSSGPRRTLTGSAEDIAEDVSRYKEAGVKHFVFAFGSDREGLPPIDSFFGSRVEEVVDRIEQFAQGVVPQVT
jgi:probable F420-dependent oxidoreductase